MVVVQAQAKRTGPTTDPRSRKRSPSAPAETVEAAAAAVVVVVVVVVVVEVVHDRRRSKALGGKMRACLVTKMTRATWG